MADIANPQLSWNLARDASEVLGYHFMVNALQAGSIVAVMAAVVGWFMVLRREAFAGHTLSLMSFPGASGGGADRGAGRVGVLRLLRRGGSGDRPALRTRAALAERAVGADRLGAGARAGRWVPVPEPLRRRARRSGDPAVRDGGGHLRRSGADAGGGRRGDACGAGGAGAPAAVRLGRRRRRKRAGCADRGSRRASWWCSGWRSRRRPGHRRAAGVRAAAGARRERAGDHRAASGSASR